MTRRGAPTRRRRRTPEPPGADVLTPEAIEALRADLERRVAAEAPGRGARPAVPRPGVKRRKGKARPGPARAEPDGAPFRWNADPEDVQRSVVKLVLTLVEFLRELMERQTLRRIDAGTLTPEETERVGLALMRLEETVRALAGQFGLTPEELNLDLGPLGRLR